MLSLVRMRAGSPRVTECCSCPIPAASVTVDATAFSQSLMATKNVRPGGVGAGQGRAGQGRAGRGRKGRGLLGIIGGQTKAQTVMRGTCSSIGNQVAGMAILRVGHIARRLPRSGPHSSPPRPRLLQVTNSSLAEALAGVCQGGVDTKIAEVSAKAIAEVGCGAGLGAGSSRLQAHCFAAAQQCIVSQTNCSSTRLYALQAAVTALATVSVKIDTSSGGSACGEGNATGAWGLRDRLLTLAAVLLHWPAFIHQAMRRHPFVMPCLCACSPQRGSCNQRGIQPSK